jgi:HAD superfamily hydrolase (TIGR01490 family)
VSLAIFDLDNTLLAGDSDHLWGEFLCEQGVVDPEYYARENNRFYEEYKNGTLDIFEFLRFSLKPLSDHAPATLERWRSEFLRTCIDPIILPKGRALLQQHREKGDRLLIITATNSFVTSPIAERLGVNDLLATEPEKVDGRYTGQVAGIPCYREGKVQRLEYWLSAERLDLRHSCFYSDSHNDLPLLEQVTRPVAVDPDPLLDEHARRHGWPIITLRD